MDEHKLKADFSRVIMRNPQLSKTLKDAWDAPIGSSKRHNASKIISVVGKLRQNKIFDGSGGPAIATTTDPRGRIPSNYDDIMNASTTNSYQSPPVAPIRDVYGSSSGPVAGSLPWVAKTVGQGVSEAVQGLGSIIGSVPSTYYNLGKDTLESMGKSLISSYKPLGGIAAANETFLTGKPLEQTTGAKIFSIGSMGQTPAQAPVTAPVTTPAVAKPSATGAKAGTTMPWITPNMWNQPFGTTASSAPKDTTLGAGTDIPSGPADQNAPSPTGATDPTVNAYYTKFPWLESILGANPTLDEFTQALGAHVDDLQKMFPGIDISSLASASVLNGQKGSLVDMLNQKLGLDALTYQAKNMLDQGQNLQGNLTDYIVGRDKFVKDIDKMIDDVQNKQLYSAWNDPNIVAQNKDYLNFLYTLKGRQNANYDDIVKRASDKWTKDYTSLTNEITAVTSQYNAELPLLQTDADALKTKISDLYNQLTGMDTDSSALIEWQTGINKDQQATIGQMLDNAKKMGIGVTIDENGNPYYDPTKVGGGLAEGDYEKQVSEIINSPAYGFTTIKDKDTSAPIYLLPIGTNQNFVALVEQLKASQKDPAAITAAIKAGVDGRLKESTDPAVNLGNLYKLKNIFIDAKRNGVDNVFTGVPNAINSMELAKFIYKNTESVVSSYVKNKATEVVAALEKLITINPADGVALKKWKKDNSGLDSNFLDTAILKYQQQSNLSGGAASIDSLKGIFGLEKTGQWGLGWGGSTDPDAVALAVAQSFAQYYADEFGVDVSQLK